MLTVRMPNAVYSCLSDAISARIQARLMAVERVTLQSSLRQDCRADSLRKVPGRETEIQWLATNAFKRFVLPLVLLIRRYRTFVATRRDSLRAQAQRLEATEEAQFDVKEPFSTNASPSKLFVTPGRKQHIRSKPRTSDCIRKYQPSRTGSQ